MRLIVETKTNSWSPRLLPGECRRSVYTSWAKAPARSRIGGYDDALFRIFRAVAHRISSGPNVSSRDTVRFRPQSAEAARAYPLGRGGRSRDEFQGAHFCLHANWRDQCDLRGLEGFHAWWGEVVRVWSDWEFRPRDWSRRLWLNVCAYRAGRSTGLRLDCR